jgi:thymidylate synthase ThyX
MTEERTEIENFRKAMGTLPSQSPKKNYDYKNCLETIYVKLTDCPSNPYKTLVRMSTATWGDGQVTEGHGSTQKWEQLSPMNRYIVALSVLTGNTLPTALESVSFTFEFNGVPRHAFDQFVRMRIGAGHASIGSRDNNKLDSPFVLYPSLYKEIENDMFLKAQFEEWIVKTKDLYEKILGTTEGSWQTARAVLPMSYSHSWVSYVNLMCLRGQMSRRLMACEEAPMVLIFWKMRKEIEDRFPLIANYLRPVCDNAKKCVYHEGPEGLTKYFSALFAGCGRWLTKEKYSEFNNSCSDYSEIGKYVKIVGPNDWIHYTPDSYNNLSAADKILFEEE